VVSYLAEIRDAKHKSFCGRIFRQFQEYHATWHEYCTIRKDALGSTNDVNTINITNDMEIKGLLVDSEGTKGGCELPSEIVGLLMDLHLGPDAVWRWRQLDRSK